MLRHVTWADALFIQAAANAFNLIIYIKESIPGFATYVICCYFQLNDQKQLSKLDLMNMFIHNLLFCCMFPEREAPFVFGLC